MDIQRIIAFVVFSFSLLLLWENWQVYNQPKPTATEVTPGVPAAPARVDEVPTAPAQPLQAKPDAPQATAEAAARRGARAVVVTDVLRAEIDAHGGDIRQLALTRYRHDEDPERSIYLFEERAGREYHAQMGFIGDQLPNHKTLFSLAPGEYVLPPGQDTLKVALTAQVNGVKVERSYTFTRGSYVIDIRTRVVNQGATPVAGEPYYQFLRHGQAPEGESALLYTYTGPAVYTEAGKFQKPSFDDIAKGTQDHVRQAQDGWLAMVQHHFFAAWLMPNPADTTERAFYTRALGNGLFSAGVILPTLNLAPGQEQTLNMRLYAGPQELDKIKELAPNLDLVVDYGWLTILAYPIFILLSWLHKLVENWGVAIILLTVLIKLAFYPLSAASYKSMAKMRKLAPRLQLLKERYGDDRQKMHEQMMKIYQEEKINPLGGCLPILIQIPVFIALYWALLGAVELRQAPFALWITDLSKPDPYFVLPILMAITSYIQVKLAPASPDPVQQRIMMALPLIFSVMFIFFPAGLVLYWLVNNVLSILQQWRINHVVEQAGKAGNGNKR